MDVQAITIGSQVLYDGPHDPGYLPVYHVGIVQALGTKRAVVRYPWGGVLFLRYECLRVVAVAAAA